MAVIYKGEVWHQTSIRASFFRLLKSSNSQETVSITRKGNDGSDEFLEVLISELTEAYQ
jgi:hypothetical protein